MLLMKFDYDWPAGLSDINVWKRGRTHGRTHAWTPARVSYYKLTLSLRLWWAKNVVCVTSKASDQSAHMRSLIRAFVSRLSIILLLSYRLNIICRLRRLFWVYTCQNATLLRLIWHITFSRGVDLILMLSFHGLFYAAQGINMTYWRLTVFHSTALITVVSFKCFKVISTT